jgi:lysophospholipase L1-like esterase
MGFRTTASVLTILALTTICAHAANSDDTGPVCTARKIAFCDVVDRPGLPRVLLIGDSVSVGYTLGVRQRLSNIANVHRIPQNGGSTKTGLRFVAQWLGAKRWDVIHVNFGLHDVQTVSPGVPQTDVATYEENAKTIIVKLKSMAPHVIWATTTPVPADEEVSAYRGADVAAYNRVAIRVARDEGVAIDDLYGLVLPQEMQLQRPGNIHFTPHGYDVLADAVAASIAAQLRQK